MFSLMQTHFFRIIDETDVYVDVHNKVRVVRRPPMHRPPTKALGPLLKGKFLVPHLCKGSKADDSVWFSVDVMDRRRSKDNSRVSKETVRGRAIYGSLGQQDWETFIPSASGARMSLASLPSCLPAAYG
jgi:hypothetical protein